VHNGVGIYRSKVPVPRAFWTCAPQPVGRQEMEYRLRHSSYDANVGLRPHLIFNVRWPPGIVDADRAQTEAALGLAPHRDIADRTWEYNLLDRSPQNVEAIVRHPLVEDTQGIDRANMVLPISRHRCRHSTSRRPNRCSALTNVTHPSQPLSRRRTALTVE
jgi:hypothetical protein